MGRPCTTCHHADRVEIDRDLASATPFRNILERAPDLSLGALSRHREHMAVELARAVAVERAVQAGSVLEQLADLAATAQRLLLRAEEAGRDSVALSAIREVRATLLSLGAVAAAIEQRRARLSEDEAETEALGIALRDVLPAHPSAAADLSRALAEAGQLDLSQAIRLLVAHPAAQPEPGTARGNSLRHVQSTSPGHEPPVGGRTTAQDASDR